MEIIGFFLYIIFIISWFLHLTARLPIFGAFRFDLILILLISFIHIIYGERKEYSKSLCYKSLVSLILVIIIITPFSEWPGSVLRMGIPNYIKAVVFFFFSVWYLSNIKRIKIFLIVFVGCQSFRVIEPLYLHVTQGYWGSIASMANWETMNRLSGAPLDVINPNGLAFVVLTIIPFFIVLFHENTLWKILGITVVPASLYVLYLTGSRSGMLGLLIIILTYLHYSKKKILIICVIFISSLFVLPHIEGNLKDRYLSIFYSDTKNARTAEGRINGIINDFKLGLRKPILGHGLGTSREVSANYGGGDQLSHNIYMETFQEIGVVGLIFFLMFIWSIIKLNLYIFRCDENNYYIRLRKAILILSLMNLFFGMASYGLSSYEWYFLGGISVVINMPLRKLEDEEKGTSDREMASRGDKDFYPLRLS